MLKYIYDSFNKGKVSKDRLFFAVWEQVKKLSSSLIRKYNRTMNEEYEDLMQASMLAVLEHLLDYDPKKAMPGTYFIAYINEAQRALCLKNRSLYYVTTAKRLNEAARKAGFSGIEDRGLNDTALSALSGVPIKTVRNTRYQIFISGNTDDIDEKNDMPYGSTPEDAMIERESLKELLSIISDTLNDYELHVFIDFAVRNRKAAELISCLSYNDGYRRYGLKKCPAEGSIRQTVYRCRKKLVKAVTERDISEEDMIEDASVDELMRLINR